MFNLNSNQKMQIKSHNKIPTYHSVEMKNIGYY